MHAIDILFALCIIYEVHDSAVGPRTRANLMRAMYRTANKTHLHRQCLITPWKRFVHTQCQLSSSRLERKQCKHVHGLNYLDYYISLCTMWHQTFSPAKQVFWLPTNQLTLVTSSDVRNIKSFVKYEMLI